MKGLRIQNDKIPLIIKVHVLHKQTNKTISNKTIKINTDENAINRHTIAYSMLPSQHPAEREEVVHRPKRLYSPPEVTWQNDSM